MERTRRYSGRSVVVALVLGVGLGCSSSSPGQPGSGGAPGVGGTQTGGQSGTGGLGGQTGTGGSYASGGAGAAGQSGNGGAQGGAGGSSSGGSCGSGDLSGAMWHPTYASSSAGSSSDSPQANDGSTSTAWLAASTDSKPWWKVFLEISYAVQAIELTFPAAGNYRYTIEVSTDGSAWKTVVDQSSSTSTDQARCATGDFGTHITYIRVNLLGWPSGQPPGLAEVSVGGIAGG